jgi:Papain-like cysteine protease AvrRpt2
MPALNFKMQDQEQSEWCWAAVAASTSMHYDPNSGWTQCKVAGAELQVQNCCQDPLPAACNKRWRVHSALRTTKNLTRFTTNAEKFSVVQHEIDSQRSLCARIGWKGSNSGHFVVIDGYDDSGGLQLLTVRDPNAKVRTAIVNYATLVKGYQGSGVWTDSFFTQAPPPGQ